MLRILIKNSKQLDLFARTVVARSRTFVSKKDDDNKKSTGFTAGNIFKNLCSIFQSRETDSEESESYFERDLSERFPNHADIVVIGGGAIGSSVAYWMKQKIHKEMSVVVVEQDPTYSKASTTLSVGGLRQQFSLEENIQMSLYGAEFIRNVEEHLGINGEPPIDLCFKPHGYLLLASEEGAHTLKKNSKLQNSMGAKNILLTPPKLKNMFPWIRTEDIALGCLGLEKEGWFDPWALLCAFKKKAIHLGVRYVHAEAKDFELKTMEYAATKEACLKLHSLVVETPSGERKTIKFAIAVIAAGPFSSKVAKMAHIGVGTGIFATALPVEPRKRFVYCVNCPDGPGLNTPLTVDPTGTYFRREGLVNNYICGRSPEPNEEPPIDDLNVDHGYFEEKIWPVLAKRVKGFEKLKVMSSWAGYYEYNTFDRNGIIGRHPAHHNLIFATGFSGHGIQQSPAVGRAVAELVLEHQYQTIELTRLGFERILKQEPLYEVNVV